jgi:RNA polymerase sigma-70 factor (ECF subfamily)
MTALSHVGRGGDRAATEAFVRGAQPRVWRLVAALTGAAVADRLTEDTFVRAFRALPQDQAPGDMQVWLLRIAREVCDEHLRTVARRRRLHRASGKAAPEPRHECATVVECHGEPGRQQTDSDGPGRTAGPDAAAADNRDDALGLLRQVGEELRVTFLLTQILRLSYAEASAVEGVPVGVVRSRVARARADLIGRPDATGS